MRLITKNTILLFIIFITCNLSYSQVTILYVNGGNFPDTDGPVTQSQSADISKCTSIQMTMDFDTDGNIWTGSGANNLEARDDPACSPCTDSPGDVPTGGCFSCWDYMYVELLIDGMIQYTNILGEFSTDPTSGSWDSGIICLDGASTLDINVIGQTWAADENINYNDLTVLCWQAVPDIISSDEICVGADLPLEGEVCDLPSLMSSNWTTNGSGIITDPSSLSTDATGASIGDMFTLTTTDQNGCTASTELTVMASPGTVPPFEIMSPLEPINEICFCGSVDLELPFSLISGYDLDWTSSDGQTAFGWIPTWSGNPTGTYFVPCDPNLVGTQITFNITVTDQSTMCTGTDDYVVTIIDPGDADATASDLDICEGEDINLMELTGMSGDSWIWSGPNGFTDMTQNPTISGATTMASGTYFVTVADDDGTFCETYDDVTINVNPISEISLTGGGGICRGECMDNDIVFSVTNLSGVVNVTLGVQGVPIPFPGFAIDVSGSLGICWDENGFLPSFSNDILHLPLDNPLLGPGTYTLELLDITQSGNDCIMIIPPSSVTITLSENPTVELDAPDEVCEGDNIDFIDLINDPSVISWDWDGPNGYTNNLQPPQTIINANPTLNTGLYTITVTDSNGCTASSETFVTVHPEPLIDETVLIQGCEDENGNVTYDLTSFQNEISGGMPYTFTWYEDPGLTNEISGPSAYFVDKTITEVYVSVENGMMCITTGMLMLTPYPMIPLLLEINPLVACEDQMLTITETLNDPAILLWYWDDINSTTGSNNMPFLDIDSVAGMPSSQVYTLTVEDFFGCRSTASIQFDVFPKPTIGTPDTIFDCDLDMDNSIDFDLASTINILTNGDPSMSVNWFSDEMGTNNITSPNPVTASPTTVYASISSVDGCVSELVPVTFEFSSGANLGVPLIQPENCGYVVLPAIVPGSPSSMYYEMPGGLGASYMPGDTIFNLGTNTLYVFDNNPCFTGDAPTTFEIFLEPKSTADSLILSCENYVLQNYPFEFDSMLVLTDTLYVTALDGTGDTLVPGDEILTDLKYYTILKNDACEIIDSTIIVIEEEPFPGMDSTLVLCEGYDQIIDFMSVLGIPDQGGIWNDLYDIPDVDDSTMVLLSGLPIGSTTYSYELFSDACGLYSAEVNVEVIEALFAGSPNAITVCNGDMLPNNSLVDFMAIATDPFLGAPDMGGAWADLNSSGVDFITDINNVDFTGVTPGTYGFSYSLSPNLSMAGFCSSETNIITVEVLNQPTPGDSVSITTCIGDLVDLDDILINADTVGGNGFFNNISAVILNPGNVFNTNGQSAGIYEFEYIIPDGSCPGGRAFISVELTMDVTAGNNTSGSACEGEQFNLLNFLDPSASVGGEFTNTNNAQIINGNLWTASLSNGNPVVFEYTVGGTGNCAMDVAQITIDVQEQPRWNVQYNTDEMLCSDDCLQWIILPSGAGPFGNGPFNLDFQLIGQNGANLLGQISTSGDYILNVCNMGDQVEYSNDTIFLTEAIDIYNLSLLEISDINSCSLTINFNQDFTTAIDVESNYIDELCPDDQVIIGTRTFDINDPTGMVSLPTATGCDSIVNVDLSFYPVAQSDLTGTRCLDDVIIVGNDTYDQSNTSGTSLLTGMSVNGCDSIVNVDLIFADYARGTIDDSYCVGDEVTINGNIYTQSNPMGQDTLIGMSSAGCDSIVSIDLNFISFANGNENPTICPNDEIILNGSIYNAANPMGQDTLFGSSASGCDSIVNVQLDFFSMEVGDTIVNDVCEDLTVIIGDTQFTSTNNIGTATLQGASVEGCDSMVNVVVNFTVNTPIQIMPQVCEDESYISPNGVVYDVNNPSGQESFGITSNGCDSLVDITLGFLTSAEFDLVGSYCNGDGIVVNGNTYDFNTPMGVEIFPGMAANGCDSIVNIMMEFDRYYEFSVLEPCDENSMGEVTIENNVGTELPVTVITPDGQNFVVGSVPYTFDLPSGANFIELMDAQSCLSFETVNVPLAQSGDFSIEQISNIGNTYNLQVDTDIDYDILSWSPSDILDCTDCENVIASISSDAEIVATISYGNSCIRSDTILLLEDKTVFVYVPNAFSPNGDGSNDRFFIHTKDEFSGSVTISTFRIFDRWGNLVFKNDDAVPNVAEDGWDGTFSKSADSFERVANGVYVYLIQLQVEGETDLRLYKGDLTVIR